MKPEVINQDILPMILSQNQNPKNDEIIKKIRKEIKTTTTNIIYQDR